MIIPWIGRATANSVLFRSTTSSFQSTPYTTKVHCSFGQCRQNPFGEIAIAYLGHNCSIFFLTILEFLAQRAIDEPCCDPH